MMTVPRTKNPIRRDALTWADVETLGTVSGWTFVRFDGAEYVMDQAPMDPGAISQPLKDDELRIVTPKIRTDYGTITRYTEHRRGGRVDDGAYAAAVERATKARPTRKPLQTVNLAKHVPGLAGRSDRIIGDADVTGLAVGSRPPQNVDGLMAYCQRKGIELTITAGGRLLVRASGGHVTDSDLASFATFERLIIGELTGKKVLCEMGHDAPTPAVTVLAVGVPSCAEHAV